MVDSLDPLVERRLRNAAIDPDHWWDGHHECCSFGGWSCMYWLAHPDCHQEHRNVHAHGKDVPCTVLT